MSSLIILEVAYQQQTKRNPVEISKDGVKPLLTRDATVAKVTIIARRAHLAKKRAPIDGGLSLPIMRLSLLDGAIGERDPGQVSIDGS